MVQTTNLAEYEDLVAPLVQALQHALQQLHLATLGTDLLGGWVGDAAVKGPFDEVGMVAVLAHLHEHVVQLGHADVGAALGLGHGSHGLLHTTNNQCWELITCLTSSSCFFPVFFR